MNKIITYLETCNAVTSVKQNIDNFVQIVETINSTATQGWLQKPLKATLKITQLQVLHS